MLLRTGRWLGHTETYRWRRSALGLWETHVEVRLVVMRVELLWRCLFWHATVSSLWRVYDLVGSAGATTSKRIKRHLLFELFSLLLAQFLPLHLLSLLFQLNLLLPLGEVIGLLLGIYALFLVNRQTRRTNLGLVSLLLLLLLVMLL